MRRAPRSTSRSKPSRRWIFPSLYPGIIGSLFALGLAVALEPAGAAERPEEGLFLTAGLGYERGDTKIDDDAGRREPGDHGLGNGTFRAGFHLAPQLAWEVGYDSWDESDGRFERQNLRYVATTVVWLDPEGWFARAGFGWGRIRVTVGVPAVADQLRPLEPRTWSEEAMALTGGIGYRYFLTERLGIVADLTGTYLRSFGDVRVYNGSIGLHLTVYPF